MDIAETASVIGSGQRQCKACLGLVQLVCLDDCTSRLTQALSLSTPQSHVFLPKQAVVLYETHMLIHDESNIVCLYDCATSESPADQYKSHGVEHLMLYV